MASVERNASLFRYGVTLYGVTLYQISWKSI